MATRRRIIVVVTVVSLVAAFVINAIWFATSTGTGRFEPVVGVFGIVAGITGLFAERWAAAQETRDAALDAIHQELEQNQDTLAKSPFVKEPDRPLRRGVFPRLHLSALDAAFAGGALSATRDADLIGALHDWRNQVTKFNSQLAMGELLTFTAQDDSTLRDLHEGLHSEEGSPAQLRAAIDELVAQLDAAAR